MCTDDTCDNIRFYLLRRYQLSEADAISRSYSPDTNGYFHFPMNIDSELGHETSTEFDDLGRYFTLQAFIDQDYIVPMNPQAPNYSRPYANVVFKSNYWYDVCGGIFKSNRYDIFSQSNGQNLIPTSNSVVQTPSVCETINVVQSGIRTFFEDGRNEKWTVTTNATLWERFIGDTITMAIKIDIGKNEIEVIKFIDVIVEE